MLVGPEMNATEK